MNTKKLTREALTAKLDAAGLFYDGLVAKKDGSFEVRRAYFYRMGQSAESWAEKVAAAVPGMAVSGRDDGARWPKTSYFTAVVRP